MEKNIEYLLCTKDMARLGQHFLRDEQLVMRIAERVPVGASTLEIGGGQGALTGLLLRRTNSLTVYEIDDGLYQQLRRMFQGKIVLENTDFRYAKFSAYDVVVSSVPFYISLKLMLKLYFEPGWKLGLFILQNEFVKKLTAHPGSHIYRRISVLAQCVWDVKVIEEVSRERFQPTPHVDAEFIELRPRFDLPLSFRHTLKNVADAVFRFPNKTLINALRLSLPDEDVEKVLNLFGNDILSKRVRNTDAITFAQISKVVNV